MSCRIGLCCTTTIPTLPYEEHVPMQDTDFFRGWGGAWDSEYGHFFMTWYSNALLLHGQRLCQLASCIFNTSGPRSCSLSYHSSHPASPLDMDSSSRVPAAFATSLLTANKTSSLACHENNSCNAKSSSTPHQSTNVAESKHASISNSSIVASSGTRAVRGYTRELCADGNSDSSNHNSVRQRHAPLAHSSTDESNQDALAKDGSLQRNTGDIQRQDDSQRQTSGRSQSAESAKNASMHNCSVDR